MQVTCSDSRIAAKSAKFSDLAKTRSVGDVDHSDQDVKGKEFPGALGLAWRLSVNRVRFSVEDDLVEIKCVWGGEQQIEVLEGLRKEKALH